ncbi:hypothetical protein BJX66DRAFT_345669 [Aspergillus keveii]|uniref:Uncharacterized protein n=1 Tax=Aspergillus keveii TaxID=714993 RepID=A0ABR4FHB2_9EURO
MASGAIQATEPSSDQDTSGSEDSEAEEEENEVEEEEEDKLALPATPARQPSKPRRRLRELASIGSSDFETLQNNSDEAGAIYYNARETYKDAQHTVRLVEAARKYMEMRHDGPVTSDAEEALDEAMISADFPLEISLQLYANKKDVVRKVLGGATRETFKTTVIQLFEHAFGAVGYTITKCMATYKHSSGRGGTRAHDLDDISEAETEELLDLVEVARNRHSTGHMVVSFAVYIEFDPTEAARAATAAATGEALRPGRWCDIMLAQPKNPVYPSKLRDNGVICPHQLALTRRTIPSRHTKSTRSPLPARRLYDFNGPFHRMATISP